MTLNNSVSIPMFTFDDGGAIMPNPVFHRSWDKLHSRTVEYPFAASQLGDAQRILDVGSVKGDVVWTRWLESLPIDVHVTDYDADSDKDFKNSSFHQADVRNLPIEDNFFDKILAVSVIEHIGMEIPQVFDAELPTTGISGDAEAFKELLRVLKPGGQIVMTVPFGIVDSTIDGSARSYTADTIRRFSDLAEPIVQDYYEYQRNGYKVILIENSPQLPNFRARLQKRVKGIIAPEPKQAKKVAERVTPRHFGGATWRRLAIHEAQASNQFRHTDGVLCGVWQKKS